MLKWNEDLENEDGTITTTTSLRKEDIEERKEIEENEKFVNIISEVRADTEYKMHIKTAEINGHKVVAKVTYGDNGGVFVTESSPNISNAEYKAVINVMSK